MAGSCVYRLEDERGDLAGLLVEGEVSGVGDLDKLTWGLASSTSRSSSVIPMSSRSPNTTQPARRNRKIAGRASRGGRGSRDRMGLPAEEARVVLLQLGDQCFAAGRRQAAFHGRADDLQHQRIGQVPEHTAKAIEARGNLDSSLREKLGERSTSGPENSPADAISTATLAPRLWPTTASQPRSAASSGEPRVAFHAHVFGGADPPKPGRVVATKRIGASLRLGSARRSS